MVASVPEEAGLGLVVGTRPPVGEAGLAPSTRTAFWSLLLPSRMGAQ